jgi:hypothetical protein
MQLRGTWGRRGIGLAVFVTLGLGQAWARSRPVSVDLGATGVDDDARGRTRLVLRSGSDGRFDVQVKRLARNATFEVLVDDVKVGTLTTTGGGTGRLRFRTEPRGRDDHSLGFDPRGSTVRLRDDNGDDVLSGSIPDDDSQPGAAACCDAAEDNGTVQCESRTPEECAARGGTFLAGTSCLPNPCAGTSPPPGDIVCCIPDDDAGNRAECEDRTSAACLAEGGIVIAATSCLPNPCAPTPAPDDIQCCLPDDSGAKCEDRTPEQCAAEGGVDMGPGTCTPNPCG